MMSLFIPSQELKNKKCRLFLKRLYVLAAFLLFLLVSMPVIATVYYVDEKGVVHFVEDETQIPDKYKNQKKEVDGDKKIQENVPTTENTPAKKNILDDNKTAVKDRFGNPPSYWKERFKSLQNEKFSKEKELRELEEQRDELSKRFESARSKAFYLGDSQSVTESASLELRLRDIENRIKMVIRQLDELNKKISVDIYDELIQAGGNPSWLLMEE